MRAWVLGIIGAVALQACGDSVSVVEQDVSKVDGAQQREAWASNDNPSLFTSGLEYRFDELPQEGEATLIPWAGNYWPTYQDNLNHLWDGAQSESPAKKYERAFGLTGLEDTVSKFHGIDSALKQKVCKADSECEPKKNEKCAMRRGKTEGRCIPTWWGICHAWAPAAILLPEPKREVVQNGVTFKVQDLKALASLVHNAVPSKFISLRCSKSASGDEVAVDAYGRPTGDSAACKDTNAGTYHVILSNYLGKMKQSFVEDRTWDAEVWNQPMRRFKVTSKREVTASEANALLGATTVGATTTNLSGTVKKGAWAHQSAIDVPLGAAVKVVMSGTGDADLYVRRSSAPDSTRYDCRPFASGSAEECALPAFPDESQVFISVAGYAETSDFKLAVLIGGTIPSAYVFNAAAKRLVEVKVDVGYIAESDAETDGNLAHRIDSYTRTDRYTYVLELDATGKIIGGEWVGESKRAHPDFLWLPMPIPASTTVAGGAISWAKVKALVDQSVGVPVGPSDAGTSAPKTVTESMTVAKNAWKHFGPFRVAAGTSFSAVLSGAGDADLYVRRGSAPTLTAYDCRPYAGGSAEKCSVTGPGEFYVSVVGYAASSAVTLVVNYVEPSSAVEPPVATTTSLSVGLNEMKVITVAVVAGQAVNVKLVAPHNLALYARMGTAPTTSTYTQRSFASGGRASLTLTATSSGTLYVGVWGTRASEFNLTISPVP